MTRYSPSGRFLPGQLVDEFVGITAALPATVVDVPTVLTSRVVTLLPNMATARVVVTASCIGTLSGGAALMQLQAGSGATFIDLASFDLDPVAEANWVKGFALEGQLEGAFLLANNPLTVRLVATSRNVSEGAGTWTTICSSFRIALLLAEPAPLIAPL